MLLFQDIAVIPMLALMPLLGTASGSAFSWQKLALAAAVIVLTLGGGRLVARPVFRHIARTRLREIFTAFALLLVLVIALAFEHAGLSMALGAFLGGVLLAESEYRHEIEAAVEPFKGLLLGLFFIAVGMSAISRCWRSRPRLRPDRGLFLVKGAVLWPSRAGCASARRAAASSSCARAGRRVRLRHPRRRRDARRHAADTAQALILAVAVSMLLTPFMLALHDRLAPRSPRRPKSARPTCRRRAR